MQHIDRRKALGRRSLSEVDMRLLDILERDSRKSVVAMAKAVGLSRTAVQARLDRLEDNGDIAQYTIVRGPSHATKKICAFLLISCKGRDAVARHLVSYSDVTCIRLVSGSDFDCIVQIEADEVERISQIRAALECKDDIDEVRTIIVLETCLF